MENPDDVRVGTGVVFHLKSPALWAVTAVEEEVGLSEPQVPVIHNTDQDRDEPNPDDPDYSAAWKAWNFRLIQRRYEVLVATGTEVVSVPDGFPRHTDDWRSPLLALGVPLSESPHRAYIDWIKMVAAPTMSDWQALYMRLMRLTGVLEEDVAAALATFRSAEERATDSGSDVTGNNINGTGVREVVPRARAALRGAGGGIR